MRAGAPAHAADDGEGPSQHKEEWLGELGDETGKMV